MDFSVIVDIVTQFPMAAVILFMFIKYREDCVSREDKLMEKLDKYNENLHELSSAVKDIISKIEKEDVDYET